MAERGWRQLGFEQRLEEWLELEAPDQDLRTAVLTWVLSRLDDPYAGMRREPGFDNLWFGVIPGTLREPATVVACSLWIEEGSRTIRCDRIASLSWPGNGRGQS